MSIKTTLVTFFISLALENFSLVESDYRFNAAILGNFSDSIGALASWRFYEKADFEVSDLPTNVELTELQRQLLESSGLQIVVPSYVPSGFRLRKVQIEVEGEARVGGVDYSLIFQKYDSNSGEILCFAIQATNGGVGDLPEGEKTYLVNSPTFGQSTIEYGLYGEAENLTLLGNWLGQGPLYRFVGAEVIPLLSRCQNISPEEAVKISESLRYSPAF